MGESSIPDSKGYLCTAHAQALDLVGALANSANTNVDCLQTDHPELLTKIARQAIYDTPSMLEVIFGKEVEGAKYEYLKELDLLDVNPTIQCKIIEMAKKDGVKELSAKTLDSYKKKVE